MQIIQKRRIMFILSTGAVAVGLALVQQPRKKIHLGDNRQRLKRTTLALLSDDRSRVPLEETVQHVQRCVHGDFHELAALLQACRFTGVRHDLGDLGEVEHDVGNGALGRGAAVCQSAEDVTQSHQADELTARGGEDGELVEALLAHDFDGGFTGEVGCHGGDGFQAEGADLGVGEGVLGSGGFLGLGDGVGEGGG